MTGIDIVFFFLVGFILLIAVAGTFAMGADYGKKYGHDLGYSNGWKQGCADGRKWYSERIAKFAENDGVCVFKDEMTCDCDVERYFPHDS